MCMCESVWVGAILMFLLLLVGGAANQNIRPVICGARDRTHALLEKTLKTISFFMKHLI